jgi:hypothetical protein
MTTTSKIVNIDTSGPITLPYSQSFDIIDYDFGAWYNEEYNEFESKLAYLVLYIRDIVLYDKTKHIIDKPNALAMVKKLYDVVYDITTEASILVSNIELYELVNDFESLSGSVVSGGCINYCNISELTELFSDDNLLRQFLFCEKSYLTFENL